MVYLYKEYEVFKRSVQVRFLAELDHFAEVLVVDVGVDSEQPFQDRFCDREEILWKRYTCTENRCRCNKKEYTHITLWCMAIRNKTVVFFQRFSKY